MPKEMLLLAQNIIHENYERFTRMSRSKTNTPRSMNREGPSNIVMHFEEEPVETDLVRFVEGDESPYEIAVRSPKARREEKDSDGRSLNQGHNPELSKVVRAAKLSEAPPALGVEVE